MDAVLIKWNRVGYFHRHLPDIGLDTRRAQHLQESLIKIGHGAGEERECFDLAIVGFKHELVIEEIESQLDYALLVVHGRRGEAARTYVQGHIPPMVHPGSERQANLAHDLRPHMKCRVRIFPGFEW